MFPIVIVQQYEALVVFRFGKFTGVRRAGITWLWPIIDRGVKVDMREFVLDEPAQTSITKDNALVDIDF
ncbi:MAG: SPFH domain-containing protein, partial [Dehalococcoidia bacterium]